MKTLVSFLSELARLNVKLWLDGESLRCRSPAGVINSELRSELRVRKSEIIRFLREMESDSQRKRIQSFPRQGEIPLSFSQERLWVIDQMKSAGSAYNMAMAYSVKGHLDLDILRASLKELVHRHEVLRTNFVVKDGRPTQKIHSSSRLSFSPIDLTGISECERQLEVSRLVSDALVQPFDLAEDPLLRVLVIHICDDEYVLLIVMHHIISDEWSLEIFSRELSVIYTAFHNKQTSPLPDLTVQYADYSLWQRAWLKGEVLSRQASYWKERLGGELPVLDLPTDHRRPVFQTFHGDYQSMKLSAELLRSLEQLSRDNECTLFMILLSVFKVLLSRHSRQYDIIVGTPISNRNHTDVEGMIGFFLNTIVMRTDLTGNPTFTELVRRVRQASFSAYAHQDVPFERLVEEIQPERDMSRNPIFQVMYVHHNRTSEQLQLPGMAVEAVRTFHNHTSKFDLTLLTTEADDGLGVEIEYNTDLFGASTIERMLGHFRVLLEAVVAEPDSHISNLPLLTEAERHQLLVEWNNTAADYPTDKCVHELIEGQVEQSPSAIAVVFEEKQLTYRQLNERANQLAHYLRRAGVVPETMVGICVERSMDMIVGLLGILKAGGAYVPLDPSYPKERLAFMLNDSNVPVLLTQQRLLSDLPTIDGEVICLDTDWDTISKESKNNCSSKVSPDNLAYVIYTSGSTGKPKSVQVTHLSLNNFLIYMCQHRRLTDKDVSLAIAPISFDPAAFELYPLLIVGGKIVLANQNQMLDGKALSSLIGSDVTVMQGTPATWRLLLDANWPGCSDLKISCGGEALSVELAHELLGRCNELWNLYGPTEATICSTSYLVPRKMEGLHGRPGYFSIGRPIANTQIYILDEYHNPVPIGVKGELYIGGVGVAHGYLNRPELTAERFMPNPFDDDAKSRLYNTGDLACYLPDGNIEFVGRTDNQVKIRGFRIELGEIETVLSRHEDIDECAVICRTDADNNDKFLVAYIVCDQSISTLSLRKFLKQSLPHYMIPSQFVLLDALPVTPNGKIDYKSLQLSGSCYLSTEDKFVPPENDTEKSIAGIWQELLDVEKIGIHDNFFDLGGHSLKAVRAISLIDNKIGVRMSVRDFINQTLKQLATGCQVKMKERGIA